MTVWDWWLPDPERSADTQLHSHNHPTIPAPYPGFAYNHIVTQILHSQTTDSFWDFGAL